MELMRNTTRGFTLIELLVVISIFMLITSVFSYLIVRERVKAENTATNAQMKNVVVLLDTITATTDTYPRTSGFVCLGGTDCGIDSDADFNTLLERFTPDNFNPMKKAIEFNGEMLKAIYARCNNVPGECDNDDITEVMWYLEGDEEECGLSSETCVSEEGNRACIYKLAGAGTTMAAGVAGYCQ
jgi:prepilin-type N-terminal cleavage/methylation domain-containing protein